TDISCSCSVYGCVYSMGPPCAELHDAPSLCSPDYPVGLGGYKTLVVDGKQDHGLDKLGLYHRTPYRYDRFMRKYRSSLRHRPYITFKFKVSEIFKKIIAKDPLTPQEFDIFIG